MQLPKFFDQSVQRRGIIGDGNCGIKLDKVATTDVNPNRDGALPGNYLVPCDRSLREESSPEEFCKFENFPNFFTILEKVGF